MKKTYQLYNLRTKMNIFSTCRIPESVTSPRIRASRLGCQLGFPMYCVPLSAVLKMKSVEKHEVLRDRGVLVKYDCSDTTPVIFVSHEWLSVNHPDPKAEQFAVLQGAIRNLLAGYQVRSDWLLSNFEGEDRVKSDWGAFLQNAAVWYDYFSVPQDQSNVEDFRRAVSSIPAYIEMSAITFVLAPTIDHQEHLDPSGEALLCDYNSWTKRGWCRMELLATYLRMGARMPVIIRSERYMHFTSGSVNTLLARVAEGDFTCCSLNHKHVSPDGKVRPLLCDKRALFDVVHTLISHRLHYERKHGNIRFVRLLQSCSHIWLRGLREVEDNYNAHDNTLDDFLSNYGFTTAHVTDEGWTPLRHACIAGNVDIARQLIDENADVNANLEAERSYDYPQEKGLSILTHIAALCCCPEHEDILSLLIAHKASLGSAKCTDALTGASTSASASKRAAHWLLRKYPDWNVNMQCVAPEAVGISRWPLFVTLCFGADIDYVRLLCAHSADISLQGFPASLDAFVTACTICPTSSSDIAEYLFHENQRRRQEDRAIRAARTSTPAQLDVNRRMSMSFWNRTTLRLLRAIRLGPSALIEYTLRFVDATALLFAASEGKHRICKWLLDQKADASIPNMDGETALSLAQERGFTRVVDVLLQHAVQEPG